jgi:hypothetical protein
MEVHSGVHHAEQLLTTNVACLQVGMRHFHLTRNKYHCPIVNLDKVWALVGEEVSSRGNTRSNPQQQQGPR